MYMSKPIRRRERRVPAGGQLGLGLSLDPSAPPKEPAKAGRRGAPKFKEGTRRLFVGTMLLRDYLADCGLAWVIRMWVLLEAVDVSAFVEQYKGTGRHPYHPRMMLGLILYGMLERKWSLRELESLAARDVGAWWICGGLRPDHSTIGRFLVRHADIITEEFFIGLAQTIASSLNLKAGEAVIDGTVIEAAASRLKAVKAEALEQASKEAKEQAEANPDDAKAAHKAAELEKAAETCAERDAKRKAKGRDGGQVLPGEPEATFQKQKNGSFRPSYKPTVMVHSSGLVTGFHVDPSSETAAVEPLVEQHREVFGEAPECTMMDAGFCSAIVLAFFAIEDLDVLCPSGRAFDDDSMTRRRRNPDGLFIKSEFAYDEERDVYICPADRLLKPEHESRDAHGEYRRYRGTECANCPLKEKCTKSDSRTVKRYEGDDLKDAMAQVMRQPQAKERFRRRSQGERPFAGIKIRQGLTRFRRRGTAGARLETALHFAAWNLRVATGALSLAELEIWAREASDGARWRKIGSIGVIIAWPAPAPAPARWPHR